MHAHAPDRLPRPRRPRGRPKGSTGLQQAEPRPFAAPVPHQPRSPSPRNEEIVTAYAGGKTVGEVAAQYGISPQRVGQIIKRHGRRLTRAERHKAAADIVAKHVRSLVKKADEMVAEVTKPMPDPVVEVDPPSEVPVYESKPGEVDNTGDCVVPPVTVPDNIDELLAAAEREIERRTAPKVEEPAFGPANYGSKELLTCEKEWLARVLPGGLTPETSAQLTEAFYMAKAAKIPRGSPRYFQFMTLRCGLTNK